MVAKYMAFGAIQERQTWQSPNSPVPALRRIRPVPRQRRHVLLGETLTPTDEEGGNWAAVSIGKSTLTLITFGALDIQASRLVVEDGPLSVSASGGVVENVSDLLIGSHGFASFEAAPIRRKSRKVDSLTSRYFRIRRATNWRSRFCGVFVGFSHQLNARRSDWLVFLMLDFVAASIQFNLRFVKLARFPMPHLCIFSAHI